ncbi:MAG: glycosyltransferase [Armatimonadetes bacterium]|nr:glycosyltransferase [Armatimonadota bacterium]
MKLSVLICTYNRAHLLEQCLTALAACDPLPDEIVVVSGGTDNTPEVVERLRGRFPICKLVEIANIGLAHSQNTGMPYCEGDIVATLDDDAFVYPDWVAAIKRSHAAHPGAGGIGGKTLNAFRDKAVARYEEATAFAPNQQGDGTAAVEVRTVAGVNMSYKRAVMELVGRFDETLPAGMDVDYNWRVQKAGYKILYEPAIVVTHHNRTKLKAYLRQQFWYGRGYYLNRRKWPDLWSVFPRGGWSIKNCLKFLLLFVGPLNQAWRGFRAASGFRDLLLFPVFGLCKDISWKLGAFAEARKIGKQQSGPIGYTANRTVTQLVSLLLWTGIIMTGCVIPFWDHLGRQQSRLVGLFVFGCVYAAFLWARPRMTGVVAGMMMVFLISQTGMQYKIVPNSGLTITALDVLIGLLLFLTAFRAPVSFSPGTRLLNYIFPLLWVSSIGVVIALWREVSWYHWLTMCKGYLSYALLAWVMTRMITTKREIKIIIITLLVIQTGLAILNVVVGGTGSSYRALGNEETETIVRQGASFTSSTLNTYASYMMTFVIMSMAMIVMGLARISLLASLFSLGVGLIALHHTYTRGAWLGGLIGLALLLASWGRRGVIIGIVGCLLLIFFIPKDVLLRIESTSKESSTTKRTHYWKTAVAVSEKYPVFGAGWGAGFYLSGGKLVRVSGLPWWHNDHLMILTQIGLVGLAAWLYFWFNLMHGAYRYRKRIKDPFLKAVLTGCLASVLATLVHATFDHIAWRAGAAPHLWFLVGMMLTTINIACRTEQRESAEPMTETLAYAHR